MADFKQMIKKIRLTRTLEELKIHHQRIYYLLKGAKLSISSTIQTFSTLNNVHDLLMQQAIKIAENDVKASSVGKRPDHLCFYLLGSGARSEQTVWTDQDNGIIYQCLSEDVLHCTEYVKSLAIKISTYLHNIGYPYCHGNVMATNPRWTQEAIHWLEGMKSHIYQCNLNDIQYLYIATDLRALYGDTELLLSVQKNLYHFISNSYLATRRMQAHLALPKIPLNLLGMVHEERWGEHSGEINIKTGLYVPLVNTIKYLSIQNQLTATSTLERIEQLRIKRILTEREFKELKEAFITSLYFRLYTSLGKKENTNYILFKKLSKDERKALKSAMKRAKQWQRDILHWDGVYNNER